VRCLAFAFEHQTQVICHTSIVQFTVSVYELMDTANVCASAETQDAGLTVQWVSYSI